MFNKLKKLRSQPIYRQLQDVRVAGLLIFGIIAILVTWSGIEAVDTNYSLQQQISQLQQQNNLQKLQNNNLSLQNQYYQTNTYLELQARQLLGKASPGEKLIIVPQNVAMTYIVPLPGAMNTSSSTSPSQPSYQKNFEAWINFFFHRDNT